jgi:hypothetical protein
MKREERNKGERKKKLYKTNKGREKGTYHFLSLLRQGSKDGKEKKWVEKKTADREGKERKIGKKMSKGR